MISDCDLVCKMFSLLIDFLVLKSAFRDRCSASRFLGKIKFRISVCFICIVCVFRYRLGRLPVFRLPAARLLFLFVVRSCLFSPPDRKPQTATPKDLNDQYDEIISWSSLYDCAPIEAKKMIVNSMIKRVDVYRNYELSVELNMNIRQFSLGMEESESIPITA